LNKALTVNTDVFPTESSKSHLQSLQPHVGK